MQLMLKNNAQIERADKSKSNLLIKIFLYNFFKVKIKLQLAAPEIWLPVSAPGIIDLCVTIFHSSAKRLQ